MPFQPSETLKSRTYLGLILSQFLAAFNDQASHIVAIFYATDLLVRYVGLAYIDETTVITVVTACFISPFFFFSTLAGMLADKFSKRSILVFWKLAEVGIMGLALIGFLLPHLSPLGLADPRTLAVWSACLVVAVVFLMGTHSAFFVPAKYGVMPEILQPTLLSRGNGFLEATSFVAQIIGTTFGGFLYGTLKSKILIDAKDGKVLLPGKEWLIGVILLALAVIGAAASLIMARIPSADPDKPLTWKLWQPLKANIGVLLRSRPLALSVLGIAFFAFMTLFLRQALLYEGETAKELHEAVRQAAVKNKIERQDGEEKGVLSSIPELSAGQRSEFKVALLIALIGLGVGIGSPLAGYLSGNKVELGLVPLGAAFLALITGVFAYLNLIISPNQQFQRTCAMVACLVMIGMAASFYIVPLYTLLQHRAPKESKGNLVATSNFVNVAGGLLAVAVFYLLILVLEKGFGLAFTEAQAQQSPELYIPLLERQLQVVPSALFLVACLLTLGMLILLCRQLPDFLVRTLLWMRSHGRYRLKVVGMNNLPSEGPVILATNCDRFDTCMQVVAATDRFTRFILLEGATDTELRPFLRFLVRRTGLVALRKDSANKEDLATAVRKGLRTLQAGNLLGLTVDGDWPMEEVEKLLDKWRAVPAMRILPIYCGGLSPASRIRRVHVVIGHPLPSETTARELRMAIRDLGDWLHNTEEAGKAPLTLMIPKAAAALLPGQEEAHPENPLPE